MTAPSPMKAVLSATATSPVGATLPRWAVICGSPAANVSASERMVRPASRSARSESSGTNAPSTNSRRRASIQARAAAALAARALAAASGAPARGFASRMSARLAAAKVSASAVSAAVLIGPISAFISCRLFPVLRVAAGVELQRQPLAAGFHDAALGENVHHVRHDVIEQALIVRDHHETALGRTQPVDAVGDHLEGVDVEPGIGLVEHAEARLDERHLQDLVALLLAAGEPDVDAPAQHVLLDAELARELAHALDEI